MTRPLGEGYRRQYIVGSSGAVMVHTPEPGRAQKETGVGCHAHPGPDHLRGIIRPVPEHGIQAFGVLTAGPKGEASPRVCLQVLVAEPRPGGGEVVSDRICQRGIGRRSASGCLDGRRKTHTCIGAVWDGV